MTKLQRNFYTQKDVVKISRNLLGKHLVTRIDNTLTSGVIVETEAYAGPEDRASHAYNNRHTKRTEIMYRQGGTAYVYLCYGMHHLFNVVTNIIGVPHAILIRAIEPVIGIETMLKRRNKPKLDKTLTSGPGALSQALGINVVHTGTDLLGNLIWIETTDQCVPPDDIGSSPRIGVSYAGKDALKPWRFFIKDNPWISNPPLSKNYEKSFNYRS